jgi:hypothetical protein
LTGYPFSLKSDPGIQGVATGVKKALFIVMVAVCAFSEPASAGRIMNAFYRFLAHEILGVTTNLVSDTIVGELKAKVCPKDSPWRGKYPEAVKALDCGDYSEARIAQPSIDPPRATMPVPAPLAPQTAAGSTPVPSGPGSWASARPKEEQDTRRQRAAISAPSQQIAAPMQGVETHLVPCTSIVSGGIQVYCDK